MKLQRYLTKSRIIDIKSADFAGAVSELLAVIPDSVLNGTDRKDILKDLIDREKAISTYLGNGVCMPHTRVKGLKQKYIFAAGRCPQGITFNNAEEYKDSRMLFLLLSDGEVDSYLNVLASLARIFSDDETADKIKDAPDLETFRSDIMEAFSSSLSSAPGTAKKQDAQSAKASDGKKPEQKNAVKGSKTNSQMARSAAKIAKVTKCAAILLQGDTFQNIPDVSEYFSDTKVVLITENTNLQLPENWAAINVRAFGNGRLSQLRSAIMVGLTRGILGPKDKICCIGGVKNSNQIDTIIVLDIEKEFSDIFVSQKNMLPDGVKPEVIERILDIATELSVEGREGKPVGCIFVIGKAKDLKPHLKQLILNPFHGYKPEDRNVLNPFMDETVKEYSLIDGAFIIDGSGILEAAGALIHTPDFRLQLPGGLGSRHAAAYSISLMADCISFVVSSSTGQITLFRRGQMLPITDKRRE